MVVIMWAVPRNPSPKPPVRHNSCGCSVWHDSLDVDDPLIATALTEDIAIVAADQEVKNYRELRVIW